MQFHSRWNQPIGDPQAQFVKHAGADRHPELLSDVFTSLSNIFKHLNKHVAPQLNSVLRNSARLRYSSAAHVRQLAAESVGYLFRHSSKSGLKSGVQTVLSEQALHPTSGKRLVLCFRCAGLSHLLSISCSVPFMCCVFLMPPLEVSIKLA